MVGPGDSGLEIGDSGGRVRYSGERMRDSADSRRRGLTEGVEHLVLD